MPGLLDRLVDGDPAPKVVRPPSASCVSDGRFGAGKGTHQARQVLARFDRAQMQHVALCRGRIGLGPGRRLRRLRA